MPCYTRVRVTIDDDALTRKAVANLGFRYETKNGCVQRKLIVGWREKGYVSAESAAAAIKQEAGVLKAMQKVRRLAPTAVIKRTGNTLSVQVEV